LCSFPQPPNTPSCLGPNIIFRTSFLNTSVFVLPSVWQPAHANLLLWHVVNSRPAHSWGPKAVGCPRMLILYIKCNLDSFRWYTMLDVAVRTCLSY
jgi:hypothetical protein